MKKIKKEEILESYIDFDDKSIPESIQYLNKLAEKHSQKDNVRLNWRAIPHEEGYEYVLICDREETDSELENRKKIFQNQLNYEKQQYERLRQKFENGAN